MAPPPPPPPNSFFADQIAQDAFDANLNKTVFLIALAFAVLIQVCVLGYLGWLVIRRCCFGRSRDDAVDEEGEGDVDSVQDGGEGERKCAKGELEVPTLPRELVLPGLTSSSPSLTPSTTLPSRHHRSPSLRESIFGSFSSENQPDNSAKPASSSSWFNLRWSWEVPVVQIDLERAAAPASPAAPPPASTTVSAPAPAAATPNSLATNTSPASSPTTTASAASLANLTSAAFSVATPTQILSSEFKQARMQVPRIVIQDVDSPPSCSPSSIATIDFEIDVDSALGTDQEQEREQDQEEESLQTRIDPTYLYAPSTSCYPPRELVESPSGRGFDVSFFPSVSSPGSCAFTPSMGLSGFSQEELTPCKETKTTKSSKKTRTKIAKRKSPGAYENTSTFNADENAPQPTKTMAKKQTLSARVFGALADLSNLHFTGLTARPSLPAASSVSASPSSFKPSITPASSAAPSSLNLPTTPHESFFSRCEEALSTAPRTFADEEAMYDGIMW